MKPLVLLIDDNRKPMDNYVRYLQEEGFAVEHCFDPDSALHAAKKERKRVAVILLDIMMTPGDKYADEDTNEGLRTGVVLYSDLRRLCPQTPVIVLTNVVEEETLQLFHEGRLLKVVQKLDYPPVELGMLLKEMWADAGGEEADGGE